MQAMLRGAIGAAVLMTAAPAPVLAASAPTTWDNLVKTPSKKLTAVYLAPGEDFCIYTKIKLDAPQVEFRKNWMRDYNGASVGLVGRISDTDAQKIMTAVRTGFEQIQSKAYASAGFQVVNDDGYDVLRVRTAITNLSVDAPDLRAPGITRTYSRQAGSATLVVEVRDSMTGALLGRAVDSRLAGENAPYQRTRASNEQDFSRLFTDWAKAGAEGLNTIKAKSATCTVPGGAPPAPR